MNTEASENPSTQNAGTQEEPVTAAVSALQAAEPEEPQIYPIQDSELQDTVPQESAIQDAGPHEEAITEATSANRRRMQSHVSYVRSEEMEVESDSSREVRTASNATLMHALQAEDKKRRLAIVLIRLRDREVENERRLQEERELSFLNCEVKGKLSSLASVDRPKLDTLTSVDNEKIFPTEEMDAEDDIERSSTTSKSFPSAVGTTSTTVQADVEEEFRASSSSTSTVREDEDVDSEDVMRMAVNELMLVPSISELSLSEERRLFPCISTMSMKSTRSAKSLKSSKSAKSVLSFADGIDSDSSESESEDLSESELDTLPKLDGDGGSEVSVESAPYRASDFGEIPFGEVELREPSNEFDTFFVAKKGKKIANVHEKLAIQKGRDTHRIIQDFINALIRGVVGVTDPYQYCRSQMDKRKLLNGLVDKVKEHVELMAINQELNEQLVEYCRRTKNNRALIELSEAEAESYRFRYRAGLDYLEYGQHRVALIKAKVGKIIAAAQLELCNVMYNATGTEQHLENTMRRVVVRPDSESDLLKRLVAHELRLMAEKRNEISDTRFQLITQTHDLGKMKEQIIRLETLSDTVSMNDYIAVQTNVIRLHKKIEERNYELKKLRSQYHTELHLTKHNREKALELKDRLNALNEQLLEKNMMKNDLKRQLYEAKMEKKNIRAQTNELAYQGGILSKPALMYDYDRTVDFIREKQERISRLKETMRSISQHIHTVWAQMTSRSSTQL